MADITAQLMEAFPPEAIKQRDGGRGRKLAYVEGHTVIHRLIKATGNRFDVRVLALEQTGDLMTATVELTIPGLGSRQHIGVQKIHANGGEDLVKGAVTDALKKAATLFGVGLELYGPDYEGEPASPTPRAGSAGPGREAPAPRRSAPPTDRPAAVPSAADPPSAVTPAEEARLVKRLDKVDAHYNGDKGNGGAKPAKRAPTVAEALAAAGNETLSAKARQYAAVRGLEACPTLDDCAGYYLKVLPLTPEREALEAAYTARNEALRIEAGLPF